MSESGFASLGPTLLARKGGAKPAMRPQIAPLVVDEAEVAALPEDKLEDLGWNDMGDESGAQIVPISAAVVGPEAAAPHNPIVRRQQRRLEERVLADAVMTGPEDETEEAFDEGFDGAFDDAGEDDSFDYAAFEAEAEAEYHEDEVDGAEGYVPEAPLPVAAPPVAPVAAPIPAPRAPRVASKAAERRAAFTLRLDPERHLKLRLAATMQGVSAQALLTEALDAMLAEFDDLDVIAAHLKRH
jgi:hypothetical protein